MSWEQSFLVSLVFSGRLSNVCIKMRWIAITKEDVHRAMKNLGKPNENESRGIKKKYCIKYITCQKKN